MEPSQGIYSCCKTAFILNSMRLLVTTEALEGEKDKSALFKSPAAWKIKRDDGKKEG